MPRFYVPLDVNFPDDHRVIACTPEAQLLYVRALCLAKRTETDGILSVFALDGLCHDLNEPGSKAQELCEWGLWEELDGGYRIVRWLDHNPSRAELEALRQKDRDRKRRNSQFRTESQHEHEHEHEHESKREPFVDEFETVWNSYPRKKAKKSALKAYQARRREGVTFVDLKNAVEAYAKQRAGQEEGFTLHGATFFGPNERWKDYTNGNEPVPERRPGRATKDDGPTVVHREGGGMFLPGTGWV